MNSSNEADKRSAALRAVEHVQSGMVLGLGSGSTARHATEAIGRRLREGSLTRITAVPTSNDTAVLAQGLGIPLIDLSADGVDLAIDGMDEVTPYLDAIKGLGGALTREKIVATGAKTFVLVGDGRKRVERLGERSPVPVEILPFGWRHTLRLLEELGTHPELRSLDGSPVRTDNGNLIIDCRISVEIDPEELALGLSRQPGVVEHGLFLGLADLAYVAEQGEISLLRREA